MSTGALAWRQYRLERRMFWRNPAAAFFNFALPLIFLALMGAVFADDPDILEVIVPGIAGMAVMSSTFTALAHNLVFLRDQGILKRVRGTPMPGGAYLAALGANAVTNTVLQVVLITTLGKLVFGVDWPRDWPALVAFVCAGVFCFSALGVALAHVIPNTESAPAYINAIFLPVIVVSGVFYEADDAPAVLRDVAQVLPLKHLIDGLSGAMVGPDVPWGALLVLLAWGAAAAVPAVRGFSWVRG